MSRELVRRVEEMVPLSPEDRAFFRDHASRLADQPLSEIDAAVARAVAGAVRSDGAMPRRVVGALSMFAEAVREERALATMTPEERTRSGASLFTPLPGQVTFSVEPGSGNSDGGDAGE